MVNEPARSDEAGPPLVEVRDLAVSYQLRRRGTRSLRDLVAWRRRERRRVVWALDDITVSFFKGQVIGVVGPNGAGKSTLCLAIAGILAPSRGSVLLRAKISALLSLGAGYNRDLSGRENMRLYGAFLGFQRDAMEERLDEAIEFSELGMFIDEPIRTYSAGMKARLSFSVAMMLEPEILILDEIFAVGDRAFRIKAQRRIETMMEKSKLIIIVSHSLGFLRNICTDALWLDRGRLRQFGAVEAVLETYEAASGDPAAKAAPRTP